MRVALATLGCLALVACNEPVADTLGTRLRVWRPDTADILGSGAGCCFAYAHFVARDSAALAGAWSDVWDDHPEPPTPTVDFTQYYVLVISVQSGPSFSIHLDSVVEHEYGRRAFTTYWGCSSPLAVVASPFQVVRIPHFVIAEWGRRDLLTCL